MKNWQKDFRLRYKKQDNTMEDFFYLSLEDRDSAIEQLKQIAETMSVDSYSIEEYDYYSSPNYWKTIN